MPPIQIFIFSFFIEGVLLAYVGTGLLRIKANPKQISLVAILYALAVYLVRSKYVMPFLGVGMHSVVLVTALSFFIKSVLKIKFRIGIVAGLTSFVLLFLGDAALLSPLLKFTGVNVGQITENIWRWILFSWISDSFLLLTAILIAKKGFYLVRVSDVDLETKSVEGKQ